MVRRLNDEGKVDGDPVLAKDAGLNVEEIVAPQVFSVKYKFRMSDNTGGISILMGIGFAVRSRPVVKTNSAGSWEETDQGWSEYVDDRAGMVDANFSAPEPPSAVPFPDDSIPK